VQQVIEVLSEVAIDDRHGPKLYSRFLQGLLAKPLAKLDPSAPDMTPPAASSPSPPPTEAISSFDNFRPAGGIDPYAPDDAAVYVMNPNAGANSSNDLLMSDYFQPELPFDDEIVRSIQDLRDPSGWQDISIPGTYN
jgi:hypothetical protein